MNKDVSSKIFKSMFKSVSSHYSDLSLTFLTLTFTWPAPCTWPSPDLSLTKKENAHRTLWAGSSKSSLSWNKKKCISVCLPIDPFLRDYYFDVQANLLNICLESSCGFWVLSINIEPFYLYLILNRVYFQVILDEMSEVSAGHDLTCPLLELNFGREPQIGCIANSG